MHFALAGAAVSAAKMCVVANTSAAAAARLVSADVPILAMSKVAAGRNVVHMAYWSKLCCSCCCLSLCLRLCFKCKGLYLKIFKGLCGHVLQFGAQQLKIHSCQLILGLLADHAVYFLFQCLQLFLGF